MSSKTVGIVAAAGLGAAAAFIGYCVYFDRKRRAAPDFKAKLKERRAKAGAASRGSKGGSGGSAMPDFTDQEAVQRFFLQEVQMGEQLLATGEIEAGIEHLSMAVAVCGHPQSLLGVLQQTLPAQIYAMLLQNLEAAQRRVRAHAASSIPGVVRQQPSSAEQAKTAAMREEDVE